MSRRNPDTRRSTAARPGTRVTPCRSKTANGSKRLSAGPRPFIAESNGCVPASSSPWPQTTSPDCPGCSQPDAGKPRQACRSPASMEPKPNPAGCAERKLFRKGDFFSTLLMQAFCRDGFVTPTLKGKIGNHTHRPRSLGALLDEMIEEEVVVKRRVMEVMWRQADRIGRHA